MNQPNPSDGAPPAPGEKPTGLQALPMADSAKLAYPMNIMPGLGTTLLVCVLLYAIPRTAVVGAILLTGYLGGAVSAHVRIMNPWPSHILFPVYFGVFIWLGLYLRMPALRAFVPVRKG